MGKGKYEPKFRGRDSHEAHNAEGRFIGEKSFEEVYGRKPTEEERREHHRKLTKHHRQSISVVMEGVEQVDPMEKYLDQPVFVPRGLALRFYPQKSPIFMKDGRQITYREHADNLYDSLFLFAETRRNFLYEFDPSADCVFPAGRSFHLNGNELFQRVTMNIRRGSGEEAFHDIFIPLGIVELSDGEGQN